MQNLRSVLGRFKSPCCAVGYGISNRALADFLLQNGFDVTVRDAKSAEELGESAAALKKSGVRFFTGKDFEKDCSEPTLFRSPGLRPDLPIFQKAVACGAVLSSEIELLLSLLPCPVIGITGSDGKTTTASLTNAMLQAESRKRKIFRAYLGGNIGNSLLPEVGRMRPSDWAVLELSSFQLCTVRTSVQRAAVTNVSPNHLNWHRDMDEYIEAKSNLFRHPQNRLLVANAENEGSYRFTEGHPAEVLLFSSAKQRYEEFRWLGTPGRAIYARDGWILMGNGVTEEQILPVSSLRLPGVHNLENCMTAIGLVWGIAGKDAIREAVEGFFGVPHRLEPVGKVNGVKYYNSSIDSTPTRTEAALSALAGTVPKQPKPIVICGGYDKHLSFAPLAKSLLAYAKAVVLTGDTAPKIRQALEKALKEQPAGFTVVSAPDFRDAVFKASELAKCGDTVLLSPACASFDAFRNFEQRGETFRAIVAEMKEKQETKNNG